MYSVEYPLLQYHTRVLTSKKKETICASFISPVQNPIPLEIPKLLTESYVLLFLETHIDGII